MTWDAGIVIAPAPIDPAPPVDPSPPVAPAPPVTPAPPVAPAPPTPTPTPRVAQLTLDKSTPQRRVRAGHVVSYRIAVRNRGTAVARRVRVCDLLPRRVSVVGRARGGTLRNGQICWTIPHLRPGQRVVRAVRLRVDRTAPGGALVNRATVRSSTTGARVVRAQERVRVLPMAIAPVTSRVTG